MVNLAVTHDLKAVTIVAVTHVSAIFRSGSNIKLTTRLPVLDGVEEWPNLNSVFSRSIAGALSNIKLSLKRPEH